MRAGSGKVAVAICMAMAAPGAAPGAAAAQTAPAASAAAPQAAQAQPIPPRVKQALDRMGTALRALTAFELRADLTTEDVLETGQKLQGSSLLTMDVRQPDRLLITVDSARKQRSIYYDGRKLTVFGPKTGYYASFDAPPTIREMLRIATDRYGLETPLADLFEWGTPDFPVDRIEEALYAGWDRIGTRSCDHYAFRQEGADWQLWIDQAASALPCKLVIVNTDDPAQPQTTVVLDWTTGKRFTDAQFTFVPPAGSHQITFGQVDPGAAKGGRQ
ncbi:MAG: DUF2092 domain-containing protein [Sphingomonas sp.]|nr:DUF2092 domain-containing protein [Sphingomonas sp.]MDX3885340.1 DUF2092 domain-containing protein [Sphingomonas sp.]